MQKRFFRNSDNLKTKGIMISSCVFHNSAQRTEASHFHSKAVTSAVSVTYVLLSSHGLKISSDRNISKL